MLRQRRRRTYQTLSYHRHWFLCHRGADPSVIAEIVGALEASHQTVTVQDHDGLSMPLAEFRAFMNREIDNGRSDFIVLLNANLTGPMYRQTWGPIMKRVGYDVAFYTMRIDDCDTEGVDLLSVDLVGLEDPSARRMEIASICPTDRSRCCGIRAA